MPVCGTSKGHVVLSFQLQLPCVVTRGVETLLFVGKRIAKLGEENWEGTWVGSQRSIKMPRKWEKHVGFSGRSRCEECEKYMQISVAIKDEFRKAKIRRIKNIAK